MTSGYFVISVFSSKTLAAAVAFLICSLKVTRSILAWDSRYSTSWFFGFLHSCQAEAGEVPEMKSRMLPSTRFPIRRAIRCYRSLFLKLWSADHKWFSGSALVVLLD